MFADRALRFTERARAYRATVRWLLRTWLRFRCASFAYSGDRGCGDLGQVGATPCVGPVQETRCGHVAHSLERGKPRLASGEERIFDGAIGVCIPSRRTKGTRSDSLAAHRIRSPIWRGSRNCRTATGNGWRREAAWDGGHFIIVVIVVEKRYAADERGECDEHKAAKFERGSFGWIPSGWHENDFSRPCDAQSAGAGI